MYLALERYSRPPNAAACLRLLAEPDQQAALLAGGTELNMRGHEDLTHVIDLQTLGLDTVGGSDSELRLGATVTLTRVRRTPELDTPLLRCVRLAAGGYANLGLQNRSTVGGRVAVDRGDQDLPPVLAALGAKLHVSRLSAEDELVTDLFGERLRDLANKFFKSHKPLPRWLGVMVVWIAQSSAEHRHSQTRRDLLQQDDRTGDMLAFTGRSE